MDFQSNLRSKVRSDILGLINHASDNSIASDLSHFSHDDRVTAPTLPSYWYRPATCMHWYVYVCSDCAPLGQRVGFLDPLPIALVPGRQNAPVGHIISTAVPSGQ